jgi:hypothetical protein
MPEGMSAGELKEIYERYLAEEAAIRIPNVSVDDRGWFHLCVLQCAIAWSRHPRASFRIGRGKHFFVLHFEGPVETKPVTMFSFRSAVETGEYRFTSLNPSKLPQGLTPIARASLARLRDLYEAALPQSEIEDGVVEVEVRKSQQIDFLPIVDEARRVLDDGNQEFAPVDLSQISVPTEKAGLFSGRTTVTPAPKRRIRQVAAPAVRQETQHHYEDEPEESDRGNFLAAQSHRHEFPPLAEPVPIKPRKSAHVKPVKKPASRAAKPSAKPAGGSKAKAKSAAKKGSRPSKGGKSGGRAARKRRAG